jgi:hypothetical protein
MFVHPWQRGRLLALVSILPLASRCVDGGQDHGGRLDPGAAPAAGDPARADAAAAGAPPPQPVGGTGGSGGQPGGGGGSGGGGSGVADASSDGIGTSGNGGADASTDRTGTGGRAEAGAADASGQDAVAGPVSLDCGASGVALQASGPIRNRVNYVILGDGYVASELEAPYLAHVRSMVAALFGERNEPYQRYRRFINICVLKVASNESGVDGDGRVRDTAFDGKGDDRSRLGTVNGTKVRAAITRLLPHNMDVDWRSVVLNSDQWWHSGGSIMVWSGAGGSRSSEAAVHEGGHSFHRLADEYDSGDCRGNSEPTEVNVTADPTGQLKWKEWLGFNQMPGTGLQRPVQGGRYCQTGIWRPSNSSLMRTVPGPFNSISREKIIRDIYAIVSPIDGATDGRATLANPAELRVEVVDPAVVKVEWAVDGQVVTADGGPSFTPSGLAPGSHTVTARAYDDTPWVRGDRSRLQKTVQWSVTIP